MVKAVCVLNGENVKGTIFFSQNVSIISFFTIQFDDKLVVFIYKCNDSYIG